MNDPSDPSSPRPIAWLSQTEVIRCLGVSRTTLYRWRTELGLPAATVGRRVFYSLGDLDALLRRSADEAATPPLSL